MQPPAGSRVFLSAEWRDLVMLNYEVDPALLIKYVPQGTELDAFEGKTYISLVGFRFLHTKMFGYLSIPLHTDFEELNLRFYVRRRDPCGDRRGVVFIREVVPKRAVAYVARFVYGEKYVCRPMRHDVHVTPTGCAAEYQWRLGKRWCRLYARASGSPAFPAGGSVEEFITDHAWGYAAQPKGGCVEYYVSHQPWRVWTCSVAGFGGNADSLYGEALGAVLRRTPDSALIAEGSPVRVFSRQRIE